MSRYLHPLGSSIRKSEVIQNVDDPQVWYLSKKTRGRPARCSGCLAQNMVRISDLRLSVKGLFFDRKKNKVHQASLRFCVNKKCVTDIKSRCHNIKPLPTATSIKKSPDLGILSPDEKANIQVEGFQVEGIEPIQM